MSQNNGNDNSAIGVGVALIGAGIFLYFILLYAIAVFAALALTVICMVAWDKTVTIGPLCLSPDAARDFVKRGLWGAFLVPLFFVFCELLFGVHIQREFWLHLVLAGYTAGSLGIEMLMAQAAEEQRQAAELLPPAPPPAQIAPPKGFIPPAKPGFIPEQPAPFRFARWDDEEETKP